MKKIKIGEKSDLSKPNKIEDTQKKENDKHYEIRYDEKGRKHVYINIPNKQKI